MRILDSSFSHSPMFSLPPVCFVVGPFHFWHPMCSLGARRVIHFVVLSILGVECWEFVSLWRDRVL